jgi:hypothetical protein
MTDPVYGPDMFFSDITVPDPATVLNEPLPRAWAEGGMIEAVKRTVITGLRENFNNSSMNAPDQEYYISIEYPTKPTQYPGIWVQFGIDNLKRAGLGMGTWTKDDNGNWGEIQEWMFDGRIILTIAAETSKDRDRLADTVLAQLAFARPPDLVIRDSRKDAQQLKGLITAIENNPYVSMTLNTDQIAPGGQTTTSGTPWAPNVLLYEDNYSITCQGQFNLRFAFDGVYELTEIRPVPTLMADNVPYNPVQWRGV